MPVAPGLATSYLLQRATPSAPCSIWTLRTLNERPSHRFDTSLGITYILDIHQLRTCAYHLRYQMKSQAERHFIPQSNGHAALKSGGVRIGRTSLSSSFVGVSMSSSHNSESKVEKPSRSTKPATSFSSAHTQGNLEVYKVLSRNAKYTMWSVKTSPSSSSPKFYITKVPISRATKRRLVPTDRLERVPLLNSSHIHDRHRMIPRKKP